MKKKYFLLAATVALAIANGHTGAVSFGLATAAIIGLFAHVLGWP